MVKEQRDITFVKDSECGNCKATNRIITKVKQANPGFSIKKINVSSKEGQEMIKKDGIKKIPYIKDCPKGTKDERACTIVNEHNPDYWSKYLNKK